MSVDYKNGLAFGWLVSSQEYDEMVAKTWEYQDDFICVDSYTSDSQYIFGIWLYTVETGTVKEFNINELALTIPVDFMGEWGAKLRDMGKGKWFDEEERIPGLYLVGQVY